MLGMRAAGAVRGLAALGPRVVRLLLVPQVPAYAPLLDKAAASGRPGSVRRCAAGRLAEPSNVICISHGTASCWRALSGVCAGAWLMLLAGLQD
jgi:hypothetical protein